MGMQVGCCGFAFLAAFAVTFANFVTAKFPSTACIAVRCRWLWCYCLVYGAIAVVAFLLYPLITGQIHQIGQPQDIPTGLTMTNPWLRALVVGLTVKTILQLRLFEIPTGPGQSFPIGIVTLLQPFEPLLLREIPLEHWAKTLNFLKPAMAAYPNPQATRAIAIGAIPGNFSPADRAALSADLTAAATLQDVLRIFLYAVGCGVFRATFP